MNVERLHLLQNFLLGWVMIFSWRKESVQGYWPTEMENAGLNVPRRHPTQACTE
jgi:hypothetical protein